MKKYKEKMTDLQFLPSDKANPDIFSARNRNQGVSIVSKTQPRVKLTKSVRLRKEYFSALRSSIADHSIASAAEKCSGDMGRASTII